MSEENEFLKYIKLSKDFVSEKQQAKNKTLGLIKINQNNFKTEYNSIRNIKLKELLNAFYDDAFNIAGKVSLIYFFKPAILLVALIEGKNIYNKLEELQTIEIKPDLGIILFSLYKLKNASTEQIKVFCKEIDNNNILNIKDFDEKLLELEKLNCIRKVKDNWLLFDIVETTIN